MTPRSRRLAGEVNIPRPLRPCHRGAKPLEAVIRAKRSRLTASPAFARQVFGNVLKLKSVVSGRRSGENFKEAKESMQTYLKDCRWGRFILLRGDLISQNVDMYGEWAEAEVDLFRGLLPANGICVEVGSNMGLHAIPLSIICEHGRIFAYEPQRPIFHILCGNIALNNRLNIVARNLAVGEQCGEIEIETSDYEGAWNYGAFSLVSGFSAEARFNGSVRNDKVAMVALDKDPELASLSRVDFIKVDAEGHEPQVLRGARNLIARHKPNIFLEFSSAKQLEEIHEELQPQGYRGYWFLASRFRPQNFGASTFQVRGYDTNIIFLPEGCELPVGSLKPVIGPNDVNIPVLTSFP